MENPSAPVPKKTTKKSHPILKIIILIFLIGFIVFAAYFIQLVYKYYTGIQTGTVDLSSFVVSGQSQTSGTDTIGDGNNFYASNFADDPSVGPADAVLTVVVFEDLECPICSQVYPTIQKMMNQYKDSVRFVFRDFPISDLHEHAQQAAEAAQCAHEQGQFIAYHDKVFLNQHALSISDLKSYAQQINLDTEQFDNCLDTGKYTSEVEGDFNDGLRAGVHGTPTFFFNGNPVAGGISEDGFVQIIDYFIK